LTVGQIRQRVAGYPADTPVILAVSLPEYEERGEICASLERIERRNGWIYFAGGQEVGPK
jgi:hypothetical protein